MDKSARMLADQHIKEYFSRLNHIDELFRQAEQHPELHRQPPEVAAGLHKLRQERDNLAARLGQAASGNENKDGPKADLLGPLAVWDIVAEQLEKLVERFNK
ncbi:MAG: hypothetical protein KGI81_01855 [Betaproteobacteria bacterium]|nr:hypothetical protein [Betaproteobacteria bacterium]